jgi:hypothetical protein
MEILVALAILILGLTVIGSQFHSSWEASRTTERFYKALLLAESKLAEIDTGLIPPDEEIEEDWGELFPQYGWRLTLEPSAVEDLFYLTLSILFDEARMDTETEFDFDEAEVMFTTYILRATPERIDLTRDFGMEEEQADELAEQLVGVGEMGIDPRDMDPGIFRDLELEELIEVLPPLLQAFGMDMDDIMGMLPADLQAAFEEAIRDAESDESQEDEYDEPSDDSGAVGGESAPQPDRGATDDTADRTDRADRADDTPSSDPGARDRRDQEDNEEERRPRRGSPRRGGRGSKRGNRGVR